MDKPKTKTKTSASAFEDLISAQSDCGRVVKNSQGHNYRYADLKSVFDACLEALHKCNFALLQTNSHDEYGAFVQTSLVHISGVNFESKVYLVLENSRLNGMQSLGSAITYARRYGLLGLLALAPEDDDGYAASQPNVPMSVTPPQKSNNSHGDRM